MPPRRCIRAIVVGAVNLPSDVRRATERCAWCRTRLTPAGQALIAGAKLRQWADRLDGLRGRAVLMRTARLARLVMAVVPLTDTAAHAAGYDALFVLCSERCRLRLDDAIRDDILGFVAIGASPGGEHAAD